MRRTAGQRFFLALWLLWGAIVALAGIFGMFGGGPHIAIGAMFALGVIVGLPICLLQWVFLGSPMPDALEPKRG